MLPAFACYGAINARRRFYAVSAAPDAASAVTMMIVDDRATR